MKTHGTAVLLVACAVVAAGAEPPRDVVQRAAAEKIAVLDAALGELQDVAARAIVKADAAWPVALTGIERAPAKDLFVIYAEVRPSAAKTAALAAMNTAQREKILLSVTRELGPLLGLDVVPGYGKPMGAVQMTPLRCAAGWTEDDRALLRAEIARRCVLLLSWSGGRVKCLSVRNAEGEYSFAEKSAEAAP